MLLLDVKADGKVYSLPETVTRAELVALITYHLLYQNTEIPPEACYIQKLLFLFSKVPFQFAPV